MESKKLGAEHYFFVSPDARKYLDIANLKAIELIMEAQVPPPFYMAIDILEDILVIAAMPEYDYKKFIETDTVTAIMKSFVEAGGPEPTKEEIEHNVHLALPMFAHDHGTVPESGFSAISGGTIEGCRIYWSDTRLDDAEIIRRIANAIMN